MPKHEEQGHRGTLRTRNALGGGLFAAFVGLAGGMSATAAPAQVPALSETATQEHHVGKIIFVELVTPDLAAAEHFYGSLFESEARHHSTYVRLANLFRSEDVVRSRLEELAAAEAEIIAQGDPLPRMHS